MIVCNNSYNNYVIKIPKDEIKIDIYNKDDIGKLIKKIFSRIIKSEKLTGLVYLDIYVNELYGLIIKLERKNIVFFNEEIDIKITFNIDSTFLYEINYFDYLNLNIKGDIYFYKKKYYLKIDSLDQKKYLKLLEFSDIIYDNIDEILNRGIKLEKNY